MTSGGGGEEFPGVKSRTERIQKIVFRGDVPDSAGLAIENHGEDAVVRGDEILFFAANQQRAALRSDSRVHNHDVNGARGEIPGGIRNRWRPVEDVEWREVMVEVQTGHATLKVKDHGLLRDN